MKNLVERMNKKGNGWIIFIVGSIVLTLILNWNSLGIGDWFSSLGGPTANDMPCSEEVAQQMRYFELGGRDNPRILESQTFYNSEDALEYLKAVRAVERNYMEKELREKEFEEGDNVTVILVSTEYALGTNTWALLCFNGDDFFFKIT